jgi:hypothetical protein
VSPVKWPLFPRPECTSRTSPVFLLQVEMPLAATMLVVFSSPLVAVGFVSGLQHLPAHGPRPWVPASSLNVVITRAPRAVYHEPSATHVQSSGSPLIVLWRWEGQRLEWKAFILTLRGSSARSWPCRNAHEKLSAKDADWGYLRT